MTRPQCCYAGCTEPVFRSVPWAAGMMFCKAHLAEFHGKPTEATPPAADPPRSLAEPPAAPRPRPDAWPVCGYRGKKRR